MAPLMHFLLINFAGGFVLGLAAGLVWLRMHYSLELLVEEPLAAAMLLWSFAAPFGAGAIATGLGMLPYD